MHEQIILKLNLPISEHSGSVNETSFGITLKKVGQRESGEDIFMSSPCSTSIFFNHKLHANHFVLYLHMHVPTQNWVWLKCKQECAKQNTSSIHSTTNHNWLLQSSEICHVDKITSSAPRSLRTACKLPQGTSLTMVCYHASSEDTAAMKHCCVSIMFNTNVQ